MTTAYTSLLGLALPVQGELSGVWGDVVNNSITSLLDTSVAGTTNVSTDTDVTLTTTTGAANTARQAILLFSGARTALRTVTAPAQSKVYTVINATTGGFSVKLVGAGPTTGLTIPNGASAVVAWNGSDFVEIGAGSIGNLIVNGTLTVTGATTLQSTLAVTGNITNTAGTANGVTYLNGSKVLTSGSALTFDGTTLSATQSSAAQISLNNSSGNYLFFTAAGGAGYIDNRIPSDLNFRGGGNFIWGVYGGSEQMRLTSTGLGIGTSSPAYKLDVVGATGTTTSGIYETSASGSSIVISRLRTTGTGRGYWDIRTGNTASGLTGALDFFDNIAGASRLNLDSSGNLGLGVTPSAWLTSSGIKTLQVGGSSLLGQTIAGSTWLSNNAYLDSGAANRYIYTGYAQRYAQSSGEHQWLIAPSGTAGNAITFTQAMTLTAAGKLGIGTTSPSEALHVVAAAGYNATFSENSSNKVRFQIYVDANETALVSLYDTTAKPMTFYTGGSLRATLTNTGVFGVGNFTPYNTWGGSYIAIQVANVARSLAATGAGSGDLTLVFNGVYDSTDSRWEYAGAGDAAVRYSQTGAGIHAWYNAPVGAAAGNAITFTQAMTLDASGNLIVGATSNSGNGERAYFDRRNATQNQPVLAWSDGQDNTGYLSIRSATEAGENGAAISADTALFFGRMISGTFTERARIDASGNMGIGTSSPGQRLDVSSASTVTRIAVTNTANAAAGSGVQFLVLSGGSESSNVTIRADNADNTQFFNKGGERARIDSSGNLLVGTTSGSERLRVSATNNAAGFINTTAASTTAFCWNQATSGDNFFLEFATEGSFTSRGSIKYSRSGGVVLYNTTSDYRAKDIYGPITGSGALIDSVPVYMGKMKGATQERPMFIAHETPAYAHTGEKDAVDSDGNPVYQQMDASALIPVMWAEIQSLRKRLADAGI